MSAWIIETNISDLGQCGGVLMVICFKWTELLFDSSLLRDKSVTLGRWIYKVVGIISEVSSRKSGCRMTYNMVA